MENEKLYTLYVLGNEEGETEMEAENYRTLLEIYRLPADATPKVQVVDYHSQQLYSALVKMMNLYFAQSMALRTPGSDEANASPLSFFYDNYQPDYSGRITYTEEEATRMKTMSPRELAAQENWIWTCVDLLHNLVKIATQPAGGIMDPEITTVCTYQLNGFSFNTNIPEKELHISDKAMFLDPMMQMPGSWRLYELCADNFFRYILPMLYFRICTSRYEYTPEEIEKLLNIPTYYIGLA